MANLDLVWFAVVILIERPDFDAELVKPSVRFPIGGSEAQAVLIL